MAEAPTLGRTAKYTKEPSYMSSALVQAADRIPTAMCMRETFWVTRNMAEAPTLGRTERSTSVPMNISFAIAAGAGRCAHSFL